MDAIEAIMTRRSIRKYTDQPVPDEMIQNLLKAAMAAPTASNKQPWQFVVIRDRKILDAIPEFHQFGQMLKEAPLAILVCGDPQFQELLGYQVVDCSAATQNILLAAHAMGLGAVWLGMFPREQRIKAMRELIGIPEEITPVALISIGWPAEQKPPSERFNPERVRYDRW